MPKMSEKMTSEQQKLILEGCAPQTVPVEEETDRPSTTLGMHID